MEDSSNNKSELFLYACFFSTIGILSSIPPLNDVLLSFLDPGVSALVSFTLCVIGVGFFITYSVKK